MKHICLSVCLCVSVCVRVCVCYAESLMGVSLTQQSCYISDYWGPSHFLALNKEEIGEDE